MDLRRLKNFLTILELGSISRAADALHIAQPALSAQVRQLEQAAGCQLLSRSSRGVVATEAGLEFRRRAVAALRHLESLRSLDSEGTATPSGPVVVGMPVSAGAMLSVPLVKAARERFPDLALGLDESPSVQLGELLLRGKLDVAVLFSDNVIKGMQAVTVIEEQLFAVGMGNADPEIALRSLARRPMVLPARPNSLRKVLDVACAAARIELQVVAEVTSPHTMLQLAMAGLGVAVLPWSTIAAVPEAVVPRARIKAPVLSRKLAVAVASDAPLSPALRAVQSLLVETMQGLVASGQWQGARCLQSAPAPTKLSRRARSQR